jgi:hypothetical protein
LTIYFSKHARDRMVERGISTVEVEAAIRLGAKSIQEPGKILSNYRYFCVVYKKVKDDIFIITVKPR